MKNLFIALIAITSFASCKKEKIESPVTPPATEKKAKKVSATYADGSVESDSYEYDNQGRITKYASEYTGTMRITTYDYSVAGKISYTVTTNGVPGNTAIATLNEKGLVTRCVIRLANGELMSDYTYTYDANDYLVKTEWANSVGAVDRLEFVIENGNMKESKIFRSGVQTSTNKFTYDLSRTNMSKTSYGANWPGTAFGKPNKNMIIGHINTDMNNVIKWNLSHSFQFDNEGYVFKQVTTNNLDNSSSLTVYEY